MLDTSDLHLLQCPFNLYQNALALIGNILVIVIRIVGRHFPVLQKVM